MEAHMVFRMSIISCIRFNASFPQPESFGLLKVTKVEFKLGLGPCGRHVTELKHEIADGLLTITQLSRLPDELEPPDNAAAVSAKQALRNDDKLIKESSRFDHIKPFYLVKPERRIKFYRWGFWPVYEDVYEAPKTVAIEGALSKEQRAEHEKTLSDYDAARRSYWRGLETKQFVYKISDIHGRIEVVSS